MNDVYLITNTVNGKQYVGVTRRGVDARFREHVLESNAGSSTILHNAIRKYGADHFTVMVLESNIPDDQAAEREQHYIREYQTFYPNRTGYNMTEGGGGVVGYHHTAATKAKVSERLKGHKFPESRNKKIQAAMTGREYKDEWRQALSESRMGRFTAEDNPFFGKHHTEVTKSAISAANSKHEVVQLDAGTRDEIRSFANANKAGEWVVAHKLSTAQPLTCSGRIGEVCRSKNNRCTAYGYGWAFRESLSTNCRAEDELPLKAQSTLLEQGDDIVSATGNSR